MPTLATLYKTSDSLRHAFAVRIGGVLLSEVVGIEYSFRISGVPSANIVLRGVPPAVVTFNADVRIETGFDGAPLAQVFRGTVVHVNPTEENTTIECQGVSGALDVPFHKIVYTFGPNVTAQQAVTDLLILAVVPDYSVAMPAWTIGSVVVQTLTFRTYADAINKVAEVDGARWMEMPTGTIRVEPLDPVPSLTPWRKYFSMRVVPRQPIYADDHPFVEAMQALSPGAYYRMGEASGFPQDASGNANHVNTVVGTPDYGQAGAVVGDTAIAFASASSEAFTAPHSASLTLNDNFSIVALIKKASDGVEMIIVDKGTDAYVLEVNASNKLRLGRQNSAWIVESTTTITGTGYHLVVATKAGATVKLYIDGVDVTGAVTNTTCSDTGVALNIARGSAPDRYWNGTIDELLLAPAAITAAQVLDLYQKSSQPMPERLSIGVTSGEEYPAGVTVADGRPRLRHIRGEQQLRDVKNQVFVRGAVITQTNPDGTTDPIDVEGDANAPSPWVLNPDGTQAYNDELFENELIDTFVKAGEVANRRVAVTNRLIMAVTAEIEGDPEIILGRTVYLADPDYSRLVGNWFVEGYTSRMTDGDFSTTLSLIGGSEAGGQSNIAPFALFTHNADREVIGDREWVVITLDASNSADLDGEIVSYAWSGDITGTGQILSTRIDPALFPSGSISVTLTVTDNLGSTDVLTLTIDITVGAEGMSVPALFVANDVWFSCSPDGGITWYDRAGVGVRTVAARAFDDEVFGIGWWGTTSGEVYRTTDFLISGGPSLVMAAVGSPITSIGRSFDRPDEVWALALDARLYRSQDRGSSGSWSLHDALRTFPFAGGTIPGFIARPVLTPKVDGVWALGGDGLGNPVIAVDYDRNHHWYLLKIGGELAEDMPGPADLYIEDFATDFEGGTAAIILNSSSHNTAVYTTSDIHGDGSAWKRATGLPAKSRGRWITANGIEGQFQFGFDDNVVYLGDVANGVMAVTVAAAAMDGTDDANHGIFIGDHIGGMKGAHIVAADGTAAGTLYKTWNRFTSIGKLRDATGFPANPAGANSLDVTIAQTGKAQEATRVLIAYLRGVSWRIGDSWQSKSMATEFSGGSGWTPPYPLTSRLWIVCQTDDNVVMRTPDAGATWERIFNPALNEKWQESFARDAGGRLWGVTINTVVDAFGRLKVWYSDQDGINGSWVDSTTIGPFGTAALGRPVRVVTHPSNKDIIAIHFHVNRVFVGVQERPSILVTTSRGASWVNNENGATYQHPTPDDVMGLALIPGSGTAPHRLVATWTQGFATVTSFIFTSDDWGVTWVTRKSFGDPANADVTGFGRSQSGSRLFVPESQATAAAQYVWESNDHGETWFRYDNPVAQHPVNGGNNVGGIVFDEPSNTLYAFNENSAGIGPNTWQIVMMRPARKDGIWVDITDDLGQDIDVFAQGEPANQIAVIPID